MISTPCILSENLILTKVLKTVNICGVVSLGKYHLYWGRKRESVSTRLSYRRNNTGRIFDTHTFAFVVVLHVEIYQVRLILCLQASGPHTESSINLYFLAHCSWLQCVYKDMYQNKEAVWSLSRCCNKLGFRLWPSYRLEGNCKPYLCAGSYSHTFYTTHRNAFFGIRGFSCLYNHNLETTLWITTFRHDVCVLGGKHVSTQELKLWLIL